MNVRQQTIATDSRRALTAPDDLLERLERMGKLADGWDSYRAKAPSKAAIGRAWSLVGDFVPRLLAAGCHAEMSPALEGGIVLALGRAGRTLDIVIDNDGGVTVDRGDGEIGLAEDTPAALKAHLGWLLVDP